MVIQEESPMIGMDYLVILMLLSLGLMEKLSSSRDINIGVSIIVKWTLVILKTFHLGSLVYLTTSIQHLYGVETEKPISLKINYIGDLIVKMIHQLAADILNQLKIGSDYQVALTLPLNGKMD
uniref:Uncharacterized protein n=1 Tax=Tetranychus urticae TaxID=32264 RepID=T1KUC2_TETUR